MRALIGKCTVSATLAVFCIPWIALGADEVSLPFDIDEWLKYSERNDFSWSVSISEPHLTFQQRFVVVVRALISGNRLPESENGNDLHFVVQVASEDNAKAPGYAYTNVPVAPQIDEPYNVSCDTSVYLRPGVYTVALIVYDSVSGKGNVQRRQVEVSSPEVELPELYHDFNDIEFVSQNNEAVQSGRVLYTVESSRCLCIDIVANVPLNQNQVNQEEFGKHYSNPAYVLQATDVLYHLGLRNGRIRLSLLDALQVQAVLDRENADNIDLQKKIRDFLNRNDPKTIDYATIKAQTEASAYLLDFLNKIIKEDDCTLKAESPVKIVIVVSGHLKFAERTPLRQFHPTEVTQNGTPVHFFYFRISIKKPLSSYDDDLYEMLVPAEPRTFTFKDPLSFRKALATFISQLEALE